MIYRSILNGVQITGNARSNRRFLGRHGLYLEIALAAGISSFLGLKI
jgi:hypothetical protein